MKRAIARHQTWWLQIFVATVLALTFLPLEVPHPWDWLLTLGLLTLAMVRAPRAGTPPVTLDPPVAGRWVAINSPGTAVPSHGVRAYGQTYAVDLLMPSPEAPAGIPMHWPALHTQPEKDPRWTTGVPKATALPGYLESGHIFETHPSPHRMTRATARR